MTAPYYVEYRGVTIKSNKQLSEEALDGYLRMASILRERNGESHEVLSMEINEIHNHIEITI